VKRSITVDNNFIEQSSEEFIDALLLNLQAQVNSYEGLFRAVWNQPWFAGGFIWKWYPEPVHYTGTYKNSDYTPQNKPAEEIILKWYGSMQN
jgi:hypothetical protein